jgi:hypothetical protein
MVAPLIETVTREGKPGLAFNFHPGQSRAWESDKRVVAVIAGGRSGKTSFAPLWLHREMLRQGPGDYLVAAPSFPLIDKAAGPEVEHFFGRLLRLGELKRSPMQFVFSASGSMSLWGRTPDRQPRILFGHADDPESLEAMSAKAAWLDEAGQGKFKLGSWEAVQQRLSIDRGRTLITTKPYNLGWLKQKVYDPYKSANGNHPEIDVIRFDSTENPAFPPEEFERARATLPRWKFDMQYRGLFTRPAGLIYESFDAGRHVVRRFPVPAEWPRYVGLDFGPVNTAAVFFARETCDGRRTGRLVLYRTYHPGKRTPEEHVRAIREEEPHHLTAVGGSASEDEWRRQFAAAGLEVREPPVRDVEVGIDKVFAAHLRDEIVVFDDLEHYLDEKLTYSRELSDAGEPTERIADKSAFHLLDAERYAMSWLADDADAMVGMEGVFAFGGQRARPEWSRGM